ncbi:MAG: tetratricopeptide repeat protein [Gemmataceae bacterium]
MIRLVLSFALFAWVVGTAAAADLKALAQADKYFKEAKYDEALKTLNHAIAEDKEFLRAINLRGMVQYMRGQFKESVADFDLVIQKQPKAFPGHWQRGIALYYVGRYEDGAKQFKAYEHVSTSDVENTFWHWMCNYKRLGEQAAREALLTTGRDSRTPMNEVLELIQGKIEPAVVLQAAQKDGKKEAMFYAHFYLGLYHDVKGNRKKALEHLELAAGKYHLGNYMHEVARVHRDWLKTMK